MNRAVFLDRDGTINVDKGYVHSPKDFELLPGSVEGLRLLQDNGFLLIIITNQSGIGRQYFTESEYLEFQCWVAEELDKNGIHIDAQYYCPHIDEDDCYCRKPRTGLFEKAAKDFNIDWGKSYAIGDRMRDLTVCGEKDMRGYLISTEEEISPSDNIMIVSSLLEAAENIVGM